MPDSLSRAFKFPRLSAFCNRPKRDPGFPPKHALLSFSQTINDEATGPMIAVVDDDESMGRSLARFLKASGFQSVLFRSAEALLADPRHPRFDCLIVDIQLGGMSGYELREQLTSAGVNIPMILMTARDEKELDCLALPMRNAALMRKSDPGEALLATLRRVLHRCQDPGKGHGDA